jgi:hypothetical protein
VVGVSTPARDFYLTGARREIVHRAGCRRLAKAKRQPAGFPFGDGLTPTQLRDRLAELGEIRESTRFCRVCCPEVEPLPRWQEPVCAWKGCGLPYSDPIHVRDHGFVHPDDTRGR